MPARRGYARGTKAWGHDARTGERTLLRNLVRDGQTGLPVLPKNWEPRHPQEIPVYVEDPEALRAPAPNLDQQLYIAPMPPMRSDDLTRSLPMPTIITSIAPSAAQITQEPGPAVGTVYTPDVYTPDVYA